uniref:Uncharacterized protein n=1 Tax=Helianthus annuus TaxID=4232 RepID=A0A251UGX6_HELAN
MAGDDQSRTKSNSAADNLNQSSPIPGLNREKYEQFISSFTNDEIIQWMANMGARLGNDGNWIVDSGCTEHITYLLNLFHGNLKTTHELPTFIADFFVMQDLNSKKLIGTGKCQHGLYRMKMVERESNAMSASMENGYNGVGEEQRTGMLKMKIKQGSEPDLLF